MSSAAHGGAGALECRRVSPPLASALRDFLDALDASGESRFFHPHANSDEAVRAVADHAGRDLYYALVDGDRIVGYGLLRGWDEGYAVPSLGIAIHPEARGLGLAPLLMHFLHAAARLRGAPSVRLRVYPANERAVRLYERLGYEMRPDDDARYLVGTLSLR